MAKNETSVAVDDQIMDLITEMSEHVKESKKQIVRRAVTGYYEIWCALK
jgi:hypothetical protein